MNLDLLDNIWSYCETQPSFSKAKYLQLFVCSFVRRCPSRIGTCSLFDVLDHTNHIFYEGLSSGDDNDRDEDLQKDKYKDKNTHTQTKTNTKCFQDPMYAIFIKIRGFKDLKKYIGCLLHNLLGLVIIVFRQYLSCIALSVCDSFPTEGEEAKKDLEE